MSPSWQLGLKREETAREQQGRHPEALDICLLLLVENTLYRMSDGAHWAKFIVITFCMLEAKVTAKCDTRIIQSRADEHVVLQIARIKK